MTTGHRTWLECVDLHPDVLSEDSSEDIFALDLGTLSDYLIGTDLGSPVSDLPRGSGGLQRRRQLLRGVLPDQRIAVAAQGTFSGRLTGAQGNRVLKLLTPFGGGKSHTLAALLHGARSRTALDALPEAAGLPRPEGVRVAVVDGQFFDATNGKRVPKEDFTARTIWGWIAWALGGREGLRHRAEAG